MNATPRRNNMGFANPFQFAGRENDGLASLYYYRARYYHPTLQQFISEDPLGFYAYVFSRSRRVECHPFRLLTREMAMCEPAHGVHHNATTLKTLWMVAATRNELTE